MDPTRPPPAIVRQAEASLEDLIGHIRERYVLADQHEREALYHHRQTGELLLKAKARIPHGQWMTWVERNTPFGHRKANRFMALAKLDAASNLSEQWKVINGHGEDESDAASNSGEEVPTDPRQVVPEGMKGPAGSSKPHKPLDPNPRDIPFEDGTTPKGLTRIAQAMQPVNDEMVFLRKHLGRDTSEIKRRADELEDGLRAAYGYRPLNESSDEPLPD